VLPFLINDSPKKSLELAFVIPFPIDDSANNPYALAFVLMFPINDSANKSIDACLCASVSDQQFRQQTLAFMLPFNKLTEPCSH
jgi:hypothetical protein